MKLYIFGGLMLALNTLSANPLNFRILNRHKETESNVVFLFAHGVLATGALQAVDYLPMLNGPVTAFDFADALPAAPNVLRGDVTQFNLGQEKDLDRLNQAYQKTRELFPHHEIILVGVSRGASTIINFVTLYQPTHIKALILESPFSTIRSVIKHLHASYLFSLPGVDKLGLWLMSKYIKDLDIDGICPLQTIGKIPHTLPTLLLHSKKDKVISYHCSVQLYNRLRNAGHQKNNLVLLDHGSHAKIFLSASAAQQQQEIVTFVNHALENAN